MGIVGLDRSRFAFPNVHQTCGASLSERSCRDGFVASGFGGGLELHDEVHRSDAQNIPRMDPRIHPHHAVDPRAIDRTKIFDTNARRTHVDATMAARDRGMIQEDLALGVSPDLGTLARDKEHSLLEALVSTAQTDYHPSGVQRCCAPR